MPVSDSTLHQKKQIEVINEIERQINNSSLNFSTVDPIGDFDNDPRICLTGVHFPKQELIDKIYKLLINPLRQISPNHYFYSRESIHISVKSVRIINDPPHFSECDVEKAKKIFSNVIPRHHSYKTYFYRLLLFPSNLALIGTTEPELDEIVLDLDQELENAGIPDDKQYTNSQYFFCNITLARFDSLVIKEFKEKVEELSQHISIPPYVVNSVSLVTGNAAMKNKQIVGEWNLI